ncbi:MAG TPA: FAD-dependent thymidylate synthase, partial [Patescibacteria group bacterium]|nr:FAD-dependent thymidylate synthase [Patescibacteria group bacterium]
EQSTRYIYYDQKDAEGRYKYYIPANFSNEAKSRYCQSIDKIFDNYSVIVHKLTEHIRSHVKQDTGDNKAAWLSATKALACDMARPVLPVSSKSTVGIYLSAQSLEYLIIKLLSDETAEARQAGEDILEEARKVMPVFLERADKGNRGAATTEYLQATRSKAKRTVRKHINGQFSIDMTPLELADYWPKNELDITADICHEFTGLSLSEIKSDLDKLSIEEKRRIIYEYVGERSNRRQKPGRALERIHYTWDILCSYGIFRDLARHRIVDDMTWQELSPRFGYEIPQIVEESGLSEYFTNCFDESLNLYDYLQAQGYKKEAQYATLLGHRMRWKVTFNARQAFHMLELRTSTQGHPEYRKLAQQMFEKISEVHPVIASSMKFVNRSEDKGQQLIRLEAEKNARKKLAELDKI